MNIGLAARADVLPLARLLWMYASPNEQGQQSVESFALDLDTWWTDRHHGSFYPFLARVGESDAVGMAWLALLPRVPRPGGATRLGGDIQSVYVLPEQRARGIGSALIQAALEHATRLGANRVTVQSSRRAVPVYQRLGFASSPQLLQTSVE